MHWLKYFPYPLSWLKAIALIFWLSISLRITSFWFNSAGVVLGSITDDWRVVLTLISIGGILPFFLITLGHHLITKRSASSFFPSWFPGRASWTEGIYALIVIVIATAITGFIFIPFLSDYFQVPYDWHGHPYLYWQRQLELLPERPIGIGISIMELTAVAYLYHIRNLALLRSKQRRSQSKMTNTSKENEMVQSLTIDPVEKELNQLRAEIGVTKMHSIEKARE